MNTSESTEPARGRGGQLAAQRQATIVAEVNSRGAITVAELVERFGVSDMTIRRDLDALDSSGLLHKVHGGATSVGLRSAHEPGFDAKLTQESTAKHAIAQAAASRVRPDSAVGIGAGTTTYALARHLLRIENLTVVTNSARIADVFHSNSRSDRTVVLIGGIRTPSDALVGPIATAALQSLHLDMLFLGAHGVDAEHGLSTPNLMEAETNRAFIAASRQVVLVADHTKWGTIGLSTFAGWNDINIIVTDPGLPPPTRKAMHRTGCELVIAP
ncbi:DeoR/GlpR family DNA-binding transcription regulator [Kribbella deserti]|uniref:DeoR/GlpR family DNA-binding transcription regulator n=1 Tax=Kribbella deserti TaxID=1926257 RepID=A0ABV6QRM5_9ACTN